MSQPAIPPRGSPVSGNVASISSASSASSSPYLSAQAEADRKAATLMNAIYALYWSGRINLWRGDRISLLRRLPPEYQTLPVRAFPQGNIGDFRNLLIAGQQGVPSQTSPIKLRTGGGQTRRKLSATQAEQQAMVSTIHLRATGFRFVKMLGYGGMGVTALFETTDEFGLTHKVVAKVSLNPNRSLQAEKDNHAVLGRCLHIIGTLKASSFFVANPRDRAWKNRIDVGNDILLLEFMKNGDLSSVLEKLGTHRVKLCNRLLWMIFECLFKACIAMAWAGNQVIPEGAIRWDEIVGDLENDDPDSDYAWLHLDLDPLNVLVGDLDINHSTASATEELVPTEASAAQEPASTATEPKHYLFPIVKVSDLGCGKFVDTGHWREVVDARYPGKWEYKAPEQTTLEWEYLDDKLWENLENLPILAAGQYGRWTNLYHIGQIMWCLVTGLHPLYPPKLKRYISNDNGIRTVEYSYGCALLDQKFSDVDPRLRKLIISCMKHDPLERPLFDEIEGMIKTALDDPNKVKFVREQDDAELLRLVHWLFNEPKDAPPPHMSGQRSVAVPRSPPAPASPSPPAATSPRHGLSAGAAASAPVVLNGPQAAPAPPTSSPAVPFSSAPVAGSSSFAPPAFAAIAGASASAGQPPASSGTTVVNSARGNNGNDDGDDDDGAGDGALGGGGAIWAAGPGAREDDESSDIYNASDYVPRDVRSVSAAWGSSTARSRNPFDFSMSTGGSQPAAIGHTLDGAPAARPYSPIHPEEARCAAQFAA
ncbi:serine/threonine protein kinase [Magnaporthiopsis poae ATCC 64411]|uniref:Serine/threonine protein kinase n=1 Tax=Magnaporthiopsis poae (strain ATCC 64411 / 73-15) TaxID=644358 RepID=A0A0C4DU36_MAGP6|nr:serine/threonine protein kinase [Magnaporthiopsis poae ATCC 64411]